MKTRLVLAAAAIFAVLAFQSSSDAADIDLSAGSASQSTQLGGFSAGNALDDVANFTHTLSSDENPTWQVLLPDSYAFDAVTVFNRDSADGTTGCCPSRLRDITIEVLNFDGDANADFTGGVVNGTSTLLNAENVLGGGVASAGPVSVDFDFTGAVGNMIRVTRTVDADLSGTGGAGNADEGAVLSIDLVTAQGVLVPEPSTMLLALFGLVSLGFFRRRIQAS